VILDKDTGAPLSGGLVYFEIDDQRGSPKFVYQITGTSPNYTFTQLPNPMTLSSIGTFVDSLDNPVIPYFYPYDANGDVELYYVRVTSSTGVPQFTREAVPYISSNGSGSVTAAFENEISNPQFAEILFPTTSANYVYNFNAASSQEVIIAPDWSIIVSSVAAATVTVSQVRPAGALNIITNPGTILTINSAGVSSLRLRQRIYGSPNLWGSGWIAGSFVAKTFSGSSAVLEMFYSQSSGVVVDQLIASATLPASGNYAAYPGSFNIPVSTSAEFYPDAYIDIYFEIPLSTQIGLTSVMLASTGQANVSGIIYDQESNYRQIDHLYHYYNLPLQFKPVPSLLTGWDFPLNPTQFGATKTMTTTPAYIWDQTIGATFNTNASVVKSVAYGSFSVTTAPGTSDVVMIMQYLSGFEARKVVATDLSVNIQGYSLTGTADVRVYLMRAPAATPIPTLPNIPGVLHADGTFDTPTAGWTFIPRGNFGQAFAQLVPSTSTPLPAGDIKFTGWEVVEGSELIDTDKFAIIVTFNCPTVSTVINLQSISLTPGDIATRPAPQTVDEVLRECQYYYETSMTPGIVPTAGGDGNGRVAYQLADGSGVNVDMYATPFDIVFNTPKRVANIAGFGIYSPTFGTPGDVDAYVYTNGTFRGSNPKSSTSWTFSVSVRNVRAVGNTATPVISALSVSSSLPWVGLIYYQFSMDSRLGIY
jgi:hypothetical protein